MTELKTLDVSIISFIFLCIVLIHSYNRFERIFMQYKLFITMVVMNMLLIIIDLASWGFNGQPGAIAYFGNIICNFIQYASVPALPGIWIIYIYYMVYEDMSRIRRIKWVLIALFLVHTVLVVASLFTDWFFYVDAANVYHRGSLFFVHIVYNLLIMGYAFFFVLYKRKLFPRMQFYAMLGFFIAPVTGSIIQAFYYGVSYNWAGMAMALMVIYLNLQSKNMNTDFLTGANNRLHLQKYLKMKIRDSFFTNTFGAIMLDIDDFKQINDKLGHGVGDEALKDSVRILSESLRKDDFIARFGGDEFLVVIDLPDYKTLQETVDRIQMTVERFNEEMRKPYKIGFSMGYDMYKGFEKMNQDEYLDHLDKLMYKAKNDKKLLRHQ